MKIKREVKTTVDLELDSLKDIECNDVISVKIAKDNYLIECHGIKTHIKDSDRNEITALFFVKNPVTCPIEFDSCSRSEANKWLNTTFKDLLPTEFSAASIINLSCSAVCKDLDNDKISILLGVRFFTKYVEVA